MHPTTYQNWTETTAIYPNANSKNVDELMYLALGLAGEAGEVANDVKKLYRDGDDAARRENIAKELGDILWYTARLATALGHDLGDIMAQNQAKLDSRKNRGTLSGAGDNR